jgi:Ca2+-binding EF-hand superfamily protein
MRKILFSSLLAISLLPGCNTQPETLNLIQENVNVQSETGFRDLHTYLMKEMFTNLDKNQDNFLSSEELGSKKSLDKLDDNGDGKLSYKEFIKTPVESGEASKIRDYANVLFNNADKDQDGNLTANEVLTTSRGVTTTQESNRKSLTLFYSSDKNKNSTLSIGEFEDMVFSVRKAYYEEQKLFPDTSKDAQKEEVSASSVSGVRDLHNYLMKELFSNYDKNNDNFLSTDELGSSKAIEKFDDDKDKKLSLNEYLKIPVESSEAGRMQDYAKDLFTAADKDKDLNISSKEFLTMNGPIINDIDLNRDSLSLFCASDKNKNGFLSISEFEDTIFSIRKAYVEAQKFNK